MTSLSRLYNSVDHFYWHSKRRAFQGGVQLFRNRSQDAQDSCDVAKGGRAFLRGLRFIYSGLGWRGLAHGVQMHL
jgi:hypothetical protein